MSTYRSPPTSRPPTVVVMKKTASGYLISLFLYAFLSIFVMAFFSRVTLVCGRAEGTCVSVVERGPGIVFKRETFAIASIERAVVESHIDNEGDTLEGIALVQNGAAVNLDGSSNVGHDGKVKWAATVNAFLRDASQDRLEISRGSNWPGYVWCLIGLAWLGAVIRTRTRFIIDKDAGTLTVELRALFLRSQSFPIKDIAAAEVYDADSDGAKGRRLRLVHNGGATTPIVSLWDSGEREKQRVVDAINAALREA